MKRLRVLTVLVVCLLVVSLAHAGKLPNPKKVPFEEAVTMLNSPRLVQSWLHRYFSFDMKKLKSLIKKYKNYPGVEGTDERWIAKAQQLWKDDFAYPSETYYSKKGVCFDAANLAAYCLHKAEYEVVVLSIRHISGNPSSHAVCVFKSKKNGKWYIAGDTKKIKKGAEIDGPYASLQKTAESLGSERGRKLKYYWFGWKKFEGDDGCPAIHLIAGK